MNLTSSIFIFPSHKWAQKYHFVGSKEYIGNADL